MSNLTDFTNTFLEQSEFYGFKKKNRIIIKKEKT